ncbi:MAG: RsmD family RNA methyltransferase [Bacteroidales bacterium]|nr:RsmD family RNA methyltransferase [Bacteroidales bacterium]
MRIISGRNKGRKIVAPTNLPVRPTTDLGKESLFNILNNYFYFDRITVLDLFAGTGNISLEFASREAVSVTSIDIFQGCTDFIKKTAATLKYDNLSVLKCDAFHFLEKCGQQYDIIFADPPYDLEGIDKLPGLVFDNGLLKQEGWLIIEHSKKYNFSDHPQFFQHRKYGRLNFTFFVNGDFKEEENKEE